MKQELGPERCSFSVWEVPSSKDQQANGLRGGREEQCGYFLPKGTEQDMSQWTNAHAPRGTGTHLPAPKSVSTRTPPLPIPKHALGGEWGEKPGRASTSTPRARGDPLGACVIPHRNAPNGVRTHQHRRKRPGGCECLAQFVLGPNAKPVLPEAGPAPLVLPARPFLVLCANSLTQVAARWLRIIATGVKSRNQRISTNLGTP